jgi:hypothetical protein
LLPDRDTRTVRAVRRKRYSGSILKEEEMFRAIVGAVGRRLGRGPKPAPAAPPPVSPGPEVRVVAEECCMSVGSSCGAEPSGGRTEPLPDPGYQRATALVPWCPPTTELSGTGKPENGPIPDCSRDVPEDEILPPGPNGNGTPHCGPAPGPGRNIPESEIRLRAYLKWEAAGKPKGHESRYWLAAKDELLKGE